MNIGTFDLNLLRALDILIQERNVTRAAKRMGLSQPAMSNVLNRLRDGLGDPVLVRTAAGMIPTPRALELIEPVRQGLRRLESALVTGQAFDPITLHRSFRIAVTDHTAVVMLPELTKILQTEAPSVDIEFVSWVGSDTHRALESGDLDLAVGVGPLDDAPPGLHKTDMFRERFVSFVRKNHPVIKKRLTLKQFIAFPHVLVSPRGGRGGLVDMALDKVGERRRVAVIVPYFAAAPAIVAKTNYILTMSKPVSDRIAKNLPLRRFRVPVKLRTGFWFCCWHERTQQSPEHRWLRERVIRLGRAMDAGPD